MQVSYLPFLNSSTTIIFGVCKIPDQTTNAAHLHKSTFVV